MSLGSDMNGQTVGVVVFQEWMNEWSTYCDSFLKILFQEVEELA